MVGKQHVVAGYSELLVKKIKTMIKTTTFSLFMLALSANFSFSADWKFYFKSANGSSSYIDTETINILKNGNVRAWTKYVNESKKGTLSLKEINCAERTFTIRAMEPTDYDDPENIKVLEFLVKNWSEPTQAWEHIGASDLEKKRI